MFYFVLAEIAQIRLPVSIVRQVVGDMFGQENVSGVPAIHHALGHVDARPGNVQSVVHVPDLIHGAAVNSHPQLDTGIFLKLLRDFQRATHRFFRVAKEKKRHPVSSRDAH